MKIYGVNDDYGMTAKLESLDVAQETEKTYRTEHRARGLGFNNIHRKGTVSLTPQEAWERFLAEQQSELEDAREQVARYQRMIEQAKQALDALEVARG